MKKRSSEIWMKYTGASVSKTVGDIQSLLSEHGAKSVLTEYDNGEVSGIFFELEIHGRKIGYRMPCKWEAVHKMVNEAMGPRAKKRTSDEAKRIAWRQTYYWMVAQFGYADMGQVKVQQIFLPYMLIPGETDRTLFDEIEERGFLIEHKKAEETK